MCQATKASGIASVVASNAGANAAAAVKAEDNSIAAKEAAAKAASAAKWDADYAAIKTKLGGINSSFNSFKTKFSKFFTGK